MNALWVIGLIVLFGMGTGFALLLCKAAALSDRDVEYPIRAEDSSSYQFFEGSEDFEMEGKHPLGAANHSPGTV